MIQLPQRWFETIMIKCAVAMNRQFRITSAIHYLSSSTISSPVYSRIGDMENSSFSLEMLSAGAQIDDIDNQVNKCQNIFISFRQITHRDFDKFHCGWYAKTISHFADTLPQAAMQCDDINTFRQLSQTVDVTLLRR